MVEKRLFQYEIKDKETTRSDDRMKSSVVIARSKTSEMYPVTNNKPLRSTAKIKFTAPTHEKECFKKRMSTPARSCTYLSSKTKHRTYFRSIETPGK